MKQNIVQIKLPCPIRVGFFSLNRKIKVGFSFDNLSAFFLRENNSIGNGADFRRWEKENDNSRIQSEIIFGAYMSYCSHFKVKQKLSIDQINYGISQLSEVEAKRIMNAWQFSTTYGYREAPSKKKRAARK